MIGSQPRNTGLLKIALPDDARSPPVRLVLAAESPADRPAAADPLDIRHVLDWLDPLLTLDDAMVRKETRQRCRAGAGLERLDAGSRQPGRRAAGPG